MKVPIRKQWSRGEVDLARDRHLPEWFEANFDDRCDILCLNPEAHSIEQRFKVTWKSNGTMLDAPCWYPGRRLKTELLNERIAVEARNKNALAELKRKLAKPSNVR